jgi:hypothetical protein
MIAATRSGSFASFHVNKNLALLKHSKRSAKRCMLSPDFHVHENVAPLKRCRLRRTRRDHSHVLMNVVPLKSSQDSHPAPSRLNFHILEDVAPLKIWLELVPCLVHAGFPRSFERGFIEAMLCSWPSLRRSVFPHSENVAPLKVFHVCVNCHHQPYFHVTLNVASLKRV